MREKVMVQYLQFTNFDEDVLSGWDALRERHRKHPLRHLVLWEYDILPHVEHENGDRDLLLFNLLNRGIPTVYSSWVQEFCLSQILPWLELDLSDEDLPDSDIQKWTHSITNVYPIHIAAMTGQARACAEFIARGENNDHLSIFGTPLHCALLGPLQFTHVETWQGFYPSIHETRYEAAKYLLDAGADP